MLNSVLLIMDRQPQYTPEGEQIILRPAGRIGFTIIQLFWVIGALALLNWTAPALIAFFERGEIIGAARHLAQFNLSPNATYAAFITCGVVIVWFGLGGLYEIAKLHLQQDRFLLRSDALIVKKRKFRTREIALKSYEPMALRLSSLAGALEVKTKSGSQTLTSYGTKEDRQWLLELLQQRYKTPSDLPVTTEAAKERIGTYIVERRPDGITRISSSGLATIGCAAMAAVITFGLITWAIILFKKGSGGALIPLMFAFAIAVAGVHALNKRTVEASTGKLRVQWHSPIAPLLRRFLRKDHPVFLTQIGGGFFEADTGTLKLSITPRQKSSPNYEIVLLRKRSKEELGYEADEEIDKEFEEEDLIREDLVLDIHGHGSEFTADHLLRALAEATGFPVQRDPEAK